MKEYTPVLHNSTRNYVKKLYISCILYKLCTLCKSTF